MKVGEAFKKWFKGNDIVHRDCNVDRCPECKNIRLILTELMTGEGVIDHFGYISNRKLRLKKLSFRNYPSGEPYIAEAKRRLDMIAKDKANEELPEEYAMIIERLDERIKKHPPIED